MENKTKITKDIQDFCKKNKITEKQFFGHERIEGDLYLDSLTSLPEDFSPNVGGDLYLRSVTSLPEGFSPIVGGSLNLSNLTHLPKGFNLVVGGNLRLDSLTSFPEDFSLVVGGYLDLRNLTSLPEGFSPNVGDSLYLHNVTYLPKDFRPVVGGSLYLPKVTYLPKDFSPVVGGLLDLDSLTSLPEDLSFVVGGNLFLSNLTSLPDGFTPTVGGSLCLENDTIDINSKTKKIIEFKEGKYIKCDGIFTEVVSRKKNIYKVKKINQEKEFFLIVEGDFSAHGDTLKEAKKDLDFKILQDRIKKEPIYPDTVINVDRYRAITGACTHGVQMWLKENEITEKEMKAQDLLPLLQETNAFGFDSFSKLYVNKTSII